MNKTTWWLLLLIAFMIVGVVVLKYYKDKPKQIFAQPDNTYREQLHQQTLEGTNFIISIPADYNVKLLKQSAYLRLYVIAPMDTTHYTIGLGKIFIGKDFLGEIPDLNRCRKELFDMSFLSQKGSWELFRCSEVLQLQTSVRLGEEETLWAVANTYESNLNKWLAIFSTMKNELIPHKN